jgi:membrane-associated phospholipid phosphatase
MAGVRAQQGDIIRALRFGYLGPYGYTGIVSFPSFHTAEAVLYIIAHRKLASFLPVLILNFFMLTAVPNFGDHYLSDMIAGASIALLAFLLARWWLSRFLTPHQQLQVA